MSTSFVGREGELERIGAAAARVRNGVAQALSIEGAAGSGKTALVRRALDELGAGSPTVVFEAEPAARGVPFALFGAVLDSPPGLGDFEAGLLLLERLTEMATPMLVAVVEDLHWADDHSRQALATAARRLDNEPVLLLTTIRTDSPARPADAWERLRTDPARCERLLLRELTADEIAELAMARGISLGRSAAQRLHDHTGGNALYVSLLLSELSPAVLSAAEGSLPAPATLSATTVARVAQLAPSAIRLLSALAVLNAPTELPTLSLVSGVTESSPGVQVLVDAGLVEWRRNGVVSGVAFSHPLYRAAVYDELSPPVRSGLHLAAARVSDPLTALSHRVAAADHADEALARDLEASAAADRSLLGASGVAHLLRSSAAVSVDRSEHERRLLAAAHAVLWTDDTVFRELAGEVAGFSEAPQKDLVMSHLAWLEGRLGDAEHLARSAAAGEALIEAEALALLATQLVPRARGPEAVEAASRAVAIGLTDPELERRTWAYLVFAVGLVDGAVAALEKLRERLYVPPSGVATADAALLSVRGILERFAGHNRAAVDDLLIATRRLGRGLTVGGLRRTHVYAAQSLYALGRWDEAVVNARLALGLSDGGHSAEDVLAHQVLAEICAARGRLAEAEGHAGRAGEMAVSFATRENSLAARLARAALDRVRGESAATIAASPSSWETPMISSLALHPVMVEALIATGATETAESLLADFEQSAAERRLDLGMQALALRGRLASARGEGDRAEECFRQAVAATSPDDPVLAVADMHYAHGSLLRSRGHRQLAVEQWRRAREILEPLGAEPYLLRVDAELSKAGMRRTTRRRRSPLELTDREQDVATLALRGLSNKEIATELYVSLKAVEYHLRNVYGKLGVTSRRELRDRMASPS